MKMYRIGCLTFLVACCFFMMACENIQKSSKEEALYSVALENDFQEIIQYFSVNSKGVFATDPELRKSDPPLESPFKKEFIHVILYKIKGGGFKLVFLDDKRPPKIVVAKEFK